MNRVSPVSVLFAGVAMLALAACERAPEAPAPDTPATEAAAPTEAPEGDVDATAVVDRAPVAGATGGFDVKAFAGTFSAEGASLALAADGSYEMTVHAESADADLTSTGTWTVESDGARLRLDPDSKQDPDRVYAIRSNDELAQEGGGQVLRREDA